MKKIVTVFIVVIVGGLLSGLAISAQQNKAFLADNKGFIDKFTQNYKNYGICPYEECQQLKTHLHNGKMYESHKNKKDHLTTGSQKKSTGKTREKVKKTGKKHSQKSSHHYHDNHH